MEKFKRVWNSKTLAVATVTLVMASFAAPQLKSILKAGGMIAVVSAFGKDINNGFNKLWGRGKDSKVKTKVVPILSLGSGTAIGAVQVMGPAAQVDRVVAVAQPEVTIFGEIRLRALIPIANKNTKGAKDASGLEIVDQVGVSGIVDIKL